MRRNRHIVDFVDDYLHGVLRPDDAAYTAQHTEECRICRVALEEARRRLEALDSLAATEASEALVQDTMRRVRAADLRGRRVRRNVLYTWAVSAAAAAAIIGGFHLRYLNLSATSYDLQVYGQDELLADAPGSLRVRLIDRETKRPMPDIPVEMELRRRDGGTAFRLASFTTDGSGSGGPRFALPDVPDGAYELHVRARTPGRDELLTRIVELKRSWKLMLSADKPVYQPGQTIRMRSLSLRRPDLRPVAGQEITFTVTDAKGNVVFKRRDATSPFGIASADCALADEILEGTYTLGCRMGDTESNVAVEVSKYVLPKFRIDVELDRAFYQPGEVVHGTLRADYFFGKPVADADVEIAILATDVTRIELARLATRTDAAGAAAFSYRLPETLVGRAQDAGDARVEFAVIVRDSAAQEQRRTVTRVVTADPIRLEVIPEAGRLVPQVPNTIYVFAAYADGRPAQVRLAVTGLDRDVSTGALGTASFSLTPSSDAVSLTLRATDAQGLVGRRHVQLAVGTLRRDFLVRTDRAVYAGGDTLRLTVLGAGVEPVFVDFIKDGQTMLTQSVPMKDGRGEHAFDLPPELFGTIEILAYRFGEEGLPVRKQRVIYVAQARELHIAAELDRSEYRPGQSAQLVLRLTDDQGRPTPGAISLAAVDEAVFSVLDQAPGMERTFFHLEQALLQPIYAVYPWTPNLETSAFDPVDRNRFEQALFSRTAGEPSGRDAVFERMLEEGLVTEDQLRVLENPNLSEMLGDAALPESLVDAVRRSDSPHSLAASSYPAKAQRVQHARERGLSNVAGAWLVFAIAFVITGVAVWIVMEPGAWVIAVTLFLGLPCLASIVVPSLSSARHQSKRSAAMSDLRGIGQGMAILESESGESARGPSDKKAGNAAIPVREWFPETLLWRPELITDDEGRVSLDVALADSITTWRVTASAVAGDGRLGGMSAAIRVFQPFFVDLNLPVALTRGDEVAVPVVVYNYLDQPQEVELSLDAAADWFELLDDRVKHVQLAPVEVRSTSFRLRARRVGQHGLQVTARSGDVGDAIKRTVEVVPDGREVAQVFSGTLTDARQFTLKVPQEAIEGSVRAVLKIYPSTFSQVVDGLDGIFQRPYGCFEQTSSTTYPNVLALEYLRRTKQNAPDVEATARQYIHLGYQRLLGFEVDGGGFDWFGRPPANRTLTAYGLMEFEDMARVHDVDPRLIDRTRAWLMKQRNADGSWAPESHRMHIDPITGDADARLSTTAYIAWSVFRGSADAASAAATRDYLLAHPPRSIADPYVLALVCNALLAIDGDAGADVRPYLDRLARMAERDLGGERAWWRQPAGARTTFYGAGQSGEIETTALASLALLRSGRHSLDARAALAWLVGQKDRLGTWHSTQATVLALKALLAGAGQPLGGDRERVIEFSVAPETRRRLVVPADQGEVMQQFAFGPDLKPGLNEIGLNEPTRTGVGYQLDFSYHVRGDARDAAGGALSIDVAYDRSELHVGDLVAVRATVANNLPSPAPMVILDLPIPAGFAADAGSFDALVEHGEIAKYQATARSVVVYLRQLAPGAPCVLSYRLRATMPVRVTAPPARVYEYYDPDRAADGSATTLVVLGPSDS